MERHRSTVGAQIKLQRLEIAESAFRFDKPELHRRTGGIIDKNQQCTSSTSILELAMVRSVNLDQLTEHSRRRRG